MSVEGMLLQHIKEIKTKLEEGFDDELNDDGEPLSAFDYIIDDAARELFECC